MKRYLLFGYNKYSLGGGWKDFLGAFDSLDEARSDTQAKSLEYYEVIDADLLKVVCSRSQHPYKSEYFDWKDEN